MFWKQESVRLRSRPRGVHEVTSELLAGLGDISGVATGLMNAFLMHTSASLTINENADPDVPRDLESVLNHAVPEQLPYVHTIEGPDDMPAHGKSMFVGCSLTVPICDGRIVLGTWQGIFLCEHRNRAASRKVMLTVMGKERS